MHKTLILLMSVFLAGCVQDSASYLIDSNDHALTVRRQQDYFWSSKAAISLVVSRLPACQRLHALADAPTDSVKVDLFDAGDGLWNVRMGNQLWQVETETCNGLTELENDPKADLGQPVGSFVVEQRQMTFVAVPDKPASK